MHSGNSNSQLKTHLVSRLLHSTEYIDETPIELHPVIILMTSMGSLPSHHHTSRSLNQNQTRMPNTLNSIQFTLPMPKNTTTNTMPQPYDPVPPYDLDDVEANAESTSRPSNPPQLLHTDDDVELHSEHESNVVEPRLERGRGRAGKLTERECCDYAFLYFKTAVAGIVMMTFFISLFAYLGKKGK
jgi:hypothetical protein